MPIQSYGMPPARLGRTKGKILKHAYPNVNLGMVGENDNFKKNTSDTVVYRRWLPKGATASQPNRFFQDGPGDRAAAYVNDHLLQDGVTPTPETITSQDIVATLNEYGAVYGYSNRADDLYEDNIPGEANRFLGERKALVNELVLFGVTKSCTNRYYGGTGTSRNTVNGILTLDLLEQISIGLKENHSSTIKRMLQKGKAGMYGTAPVNSCFPVFINSALESDARKLAGFKEVYQYGDPSIAVQNEFGSVQNYRFISSPDLPGVQDGGAAIAGVTPALYSTSGTYADVYQVIVGSQDAWGHIGLSGDRMGISHKKPGQIDSGDPLGQRGFVGCRWYYHAVLLNHLQMAVVEVARRKLGS